MIIKSKLLKLFNINFDIFIRTLFLTFTFLWVTYLGSKLGEDYQTTDWKNVPTNIIYGSGFGGNKVIIIPDEKMVVVGRWFGSQTESTFIKMILDSK